MDKTEPRSHFAGPGAGAGEARRKGGQRGARRGPSWPPGDGPSRAGSRYRPARPATGYGALDRMPGASDARYGRPADQQTPTGPARGR